jgi:biopolymer transport protein ExbD
MKVRHVQRREDKVELMMTPMIDIVFQLLIFFIMTFKITAPEGDFNIRMPIHAPSEGIPDDSQLPPIKVRMTAGPHGQLTAAFLGTTKLDPREPFRDLHRQVREIVGDDHGPGSIAANTEIELDCDYNLNYEYVIEAITAVSGYHDKRQDRIIQVIEKIKFSPPRPQ